MIFDSLLIILCLINHRNLYFDFMLIETLKTIVNGYVFYHVSTWYRNHPAKKYLKGPTNLHGFVGGRPKIWNGFTFKNHLIHFLEHPISISVYEILWSTVNAFPWTIFFCIKVLHLWSVMLIVYSCAIALVWKKNAALAQLV